MHVYNIMHNNYADTTDGSELTVVKEEISIPIGDLGACFVVAATDYDDQELKSDKYLTMKVKTVNPYDMVIGNETVVVIITDNNGKYLVSRMLMTIILSYQV